MLTSETLTVDGAALLGIRVDLPDAPVLMIDGKKGLVACGYFSIETADKVGHALAVVSGVNSLDDVLAGKVKAVSDKAAELGVSPAMTGAEAAQILA